MSSFWQFLDTQMSIFLRVRCQSDLKRANLTSVPRTVLSRFLLSNSSTCPTWSRPVPAVYLTYCRRSLVLVPPPGISIPDAVLCPVHLSSHLECPPSKRQSVSLEIFPAQRISWLTWTRHDSHVDCCDCENEAGPLDPAARTYCPRVVVAQPERGKTH